MSPFWPMAVVFTTKSWCFSCKTAHIIKGPKWRHIACGVLHESTRYLVFRIVGISSIHPSSSRISQPWITNWTLTTCHKVSETCEHSTLYIMTKLRVSDRLSCSVLHLYGKQERLQQMMAEDTTASCEHYFSAFKKLQDALMIQGLIC